MKDIDLNDLKDKNKREALRTQLMQEIAVAQARVDALRAMLKACDAMSPTVYRDGGR